MTDKLQPESRHQFVYQGRVVYEWQQTLTDVGVFVQLPPGVRAKDLDVVIAAKHLRVGIKGNPPYLDEDLCGACKPSESIWTVEDGELSIQLTKAIKGESWAAALAGHAVDPLTAEKDRKRLMLERFQEEHSGFDFSGADFNGEIPDPSTFMGGIGGQ